MSKVALSPNASGTGTFTIASPNSNTDRTLTLPDQTATLITDSASVLNIGSGQFYKDASGNVGIGTSSPSVRLEAVGTVAAKRTDADQALRISSAGGESFLDSYNNASTSRLPFLFRQVTTSGTTECARIDSAGRFFINTTGILNNEMVGINFDGAARNGMTLRNGSASGGPAMIQFQWGTSNVGNIAANSTSVSYNTASDYRLKEDVQPMTGALAKVTALKPVTYKWKVDGSDGEGFIAHELAEVCPHAVTGKKDAVDDDGNPKYQGIDTSFLVATLTSAIQEQQAIINTLTARIEALEAK